MRGSSARKLVLAAALAWMVGSLSCVATRPTPPAPPVLDPPGDRAAADLSQTLVDAHNARRSKAGLPPLLISPELMAAASLHAADMASRRKMSHKGGDGSSPFDRIKHQGYAFRAAGENVAAGFDDVPSVMEGWMRSPGHRRNILGKFTEIGVSRAIARDGLSYWCVTFGTPVRD